MNSEEVDVELDMTQSDLGHSSAERESKSAARAKAEHRWVSRILKLDDSKASRK